MKRAIFAIFAFLPVFTGALWGSNTATLSTNLVDLSTGKVTANSELRMALVNCGNNMPRIPGATVIVPTTKSFAPDAVGHVAGTVYGNNKVDCGGSYLTGYAVSYFVNNVQVGPTKYYHVLADTTFDPTTATAYDPTPPPLPGAWAFIFGNPSGKQTINQPAGQPFTINGPIVLNGTCTGTGCVTGTVDWGAPAADIGTTTPVNGKFLGLTDTGLAGSSGLKVNADSGGKANSFCRLAEWRSAWSGMFSTDEQQEVQRRWTITRH